MEAAVMEIDIDGRKCYLGPNETEEELRKELKTQRLCLIYLDDPRFVAGSVMTFTSPTGEDIPVIFHCGLEIQEKKLLELDAHEVIKREQLAEQLVPVVESIQKRLKARPQ